MGDWPRPRACPGVAPTPAVAGGSPECARSATSSPRQYCYYGTKGCSHLPSPATPPPKKWRYFTRPSYEATHALRVSHPGLSPDVRFRPAVRPIPCAHTPPPSPAAPRPPPDPRAAAEVPGPSGTSAGWLGCLIARPKCPNGPRSLVGTCNFTRKKHLRCTCSGGTPLPADTGGIPLCVSARSIKVIVHSEGHWIDPHPRPSTSLCVHAVVRQRQARE